MEDFINDVRSYAEDISRLIDEDNLTNLRNKLLIQELFKTDKIPDQIINNQSIFKLTDFLINNNILFEEKQTTIFRNSLNIYNNYEAKNINDLANRSRNNKLQPDEIQGSTITITNLGSFGNIAGTPIINQPNVAILAVGAIIKKPAVIETPEGDTIGVRQKMMLSLAYDHRVVDGALGGMFLKRISDYLEGFDTKRKA